MTIMYILIQIACVTAYRLTGELLWRRGDSSEARQFFAQIFPAQIYDIDGDLVFTNPTCVMDKVSHTRRSHRGRVKEEHASRQERPLSCIVIANLSGKEQAETHYPEGSVFPTCGRLEQAV